MDRHFKNSRERSIFFGSVFSPDESGPSGDRYCVLLTHQLVEGTKFAHEMAGLARKARIREDD